MPRHSQMNSAVSGPPASRLATPALSLFSLQILRPSHTNIPTPRFRYQTFLLRGLARPTGRFFRLLIRVSTEDAFEALVAAAAGRVGTVTAAMAALAAMVGSAFTTVVAVVAVVAVATVAAVAAAAGASWRWRWRLWRQRWQHCLRRQHLRERPW